MSEISHVYRTFTILCWTSPAEGKYVSLLSSRGLALDRGLWTQQKLFFMTFCDNIIRFCRYFMSKKNLHLIVQIQLFIK